MCCDTCCSTCSSTQPGDSDTAATKHHASKSMSGPARTSAAGGGTPSSPFKVFRTSEPRTDTEESLEDSSNTLSRTPPYAGVEVERVEMTEDDRDGDDDDDNDDTPITAGTEVERVNKPPMKTVSDEEPLLLMPGASNTLDTLFGEVSDTDTEPSYSETVTDNPATDVNIAIVSANDGQPSVPMKLPAADVEEGEITDSDSESISVCPSNKSTVADKENAVVSSGGHNTKQRDQNQQNINVKPPRWSGCVKPSQPTSHSPPRRRTSSDQERNPSSGGNKTRLGSGDRNRSPQLSRNRVSDDRKERPAVRRDETADKARTSTRGREQRPASRGRRSDPRQLSPRKTAAPSRTVDRASTESAKFSFRGRRTASSHFVRPRRRN